MFVYWLCLICDDGLPSVSASSGSSSYASVIQKYAKVCKSFPNFAIPCKSKQNYESMQKYATNSHQKHLLKYIYQNS